MSPGGPLKLLRLGLAALVLMVMALVMRRTEEPLPAPLRDVLSVASDAGLAVIGDQVALGSSRVRLQHGSLEVKDGREHLHVLATVERSTLDFCVLGSGPSEAASSVFVETGLPVALAAAGASGAAAKPFSGESPWGVPGFRGYASATVVRGDLEVDSIAPFADAPAFTVDGGLHLLKAVIGCVTQPCTRTLELDGQVIESNGSLPISARGVGLVSVFAVLQDRDRRDDVEASTRARERLRVRVPIQLLVPPPQRDGCPDLLPARYVETHFDPEGCVGGRMEQCLKDCEAGIGHRCYSLALETQRDDALAPHLDQQFFQRACEAGVASGCTNAITQTVADARCSARAFRTLCLGPGDPWACAMHVRALLAESPRDPARIDEAVQRACHASEDDPACRAARHLQSTPSQP